MLKKLLFKTPLGGLLLGFAIAFIIGASWLYLWPEVIAPYFNPFTTYSSENFIIHYSKHAAYKSKIEEFTHRQEKIFHRLLDFLKLKRESIPENIHLYLYEDIPNLKSGISARKSSPSAEPQALIDLIWGHGSYQPLTLLVTEFSLGPPSSKILQKGLEEYLQNIDRDFHTQAAALHKAQFLTIAQMMKLEESGVFPHTLQEIIYEQFDSPRAKASLSMGNLRKLIQINEGESGIYQPVLSVETASLVKFIIDRWGIDRFKKIWTANSFRRAVKEIYGLSIKELETEWRKRLSEKRTENPKYRYLRGKNLLMMGKYTQARTLLESALSSNTQQIADKATYQLGILNFYLGKWEWAKNLLKQATKGMLTSEQNQLVGQLLRLIDFYRGGNIKATEDLLMVYPPGVEPKGLILKAQQIIEKTISLFNLKPVNLPEKFIVFLTPLKEKDINFEGLTSPQGFLHTSPHLLSLGYHIVKVLSAYIGEGSTYSLLLKEGLAYWLGDPEGNYFQQASEILEQGRWIPIEELNFAPYPTQGTNIEAACLVGYLLTQYGAKKFARLWTKTSPLGSDQSLITAVGEIYGIKFNHLKIDFHQFLRSKSWKGKGVNK